MLRGPLSVQILLHLLSGFWRPADLWQLSPWIHWPALWKVRPTPPFLIFLLSPLLPFSSHSPVDTAQCLELLGGPGSEASRGWQLHQVVPFTGEGYKHVCGSHLPCFYPPVMIDWCHSRDGRCKLVPPILMCLWFSSLSCFLQICWWILFSWTCCFA